MGTPHSPNLQHYRKLSIRLFSVISSTLCLFVYLSLPPTRHDLTHGQKPESRLKRGQRGGEGRERAETRTLLVYAAHRLTWCNVSLIRQAVSRNQMWVRARMPGYGLNQTPGSSAIHRFRESPRGPLHIQYPLQQIRQINIGLHLSRCRVALRPAVLSAARIWPNVSRYLEISFGLRGPSSQAFTPFGRGSSPGSWGASNKGNADGAVGIFRNAGRVWAPALRQDPPKKRPCATLARQVGRATNTTANQLVYSTALAKWTTARMIVMALFYPQLCMRLNII